MVECAVYERKYGTHMVSKVTHQEWFKVLIMHYMTHDM